MGPMDPPPLGPKDPPDFSGWPAWLPEKSKEPMGRPPASIFLGRPPASIYRKNIKPIRKISNQPQQSYAIITKMRNQSTQVLINTKKLA